jgi:DNA polymerase-1
MERQLEHFNYMETLFPGIKDFFFNYEMKLHEVYMDIESEGFLYSQEQREFLWNKYSILEQEATERMFEIAGHEFNFGSPKQVAEVLYNELKFPVRKHRKTGKVTTDDNALAGLYANHAKTDEKRDFIDAILNARRYAKTKSTYIAAMPDYDGRYRTAYGI